MFKRALMRFISLFRRYPTHFGQMECLKLIASPKFHEKRVCDNPFSFQHAYVFRWGIWV